MNTIKAFFKDVLKDLLYDPIALYTIIIALSICTFIVLEAVYHPFVTWLSTEGFSWLENHYPEFATSDDRNFSVNFVEWFGVFYGFFLPLLLIRAWEQLDRADREFDREAEAIKVLLKDTLLLRDEDFLPFKLNMLCKLHLYCRHINKRGSVEHKIDRIKTHGDNLLQGIRKSYRDLLYLEDREKASQAETLTTELFERLNQAINIRGDRISIFRQSLFESLRVIAVITSAMWLIPFYFLSYEVGIFGSLLKLGVTILIILVLSIIDDLDEPFRGIWRINTTAWKEALSESESALYALIKKANKIQINSKHEEKRFLAMPKKAKANPIALSQLLLAGGISKLYLMLISPKRNSKGK